MDRDELVVRNGAAVVALGEPAHRARKRLAGDELLAPEVVLGPVAAEVLDQRRAGRDRFPRSLYPAFLAAIVPEAVTATSARTLAFAAGMVVLVALLVVGVPAVAAMGGFLLASLDDIRRGAAEAKRAAAGRDVYIDGGILVRQACAAGLVDEMTISIDPVALLL